MSGDAKWVKEILRGSPDINARNRYGITPLRLSASSGNSAVMDMLIEHGAVVNCPEDFCRKINPGSLKASILKYPETIPNFFLTFDAGSDDSNLDYILKTLRRYRIKATFFVTGEFIVKFPDGLRRIVADGHIVGNHTYSHSMSYRNADQLLNELYETEYLYKKATGREITRIWRAPGLQHIYKPWVLKTAWRLGYRHIDISIGEKDWLESGEKGYLDNEKFLKIFMTRLNRARPARLILDGNGFSGPRNRTPDYHGDIMLMHVGSFRKDGRDFVFTLDRVIRHMIACGYVFDNCGRLEYRD